MNKLHKPVFFFMVKCWL